MTSHTPSRRPSAPLLAVAFATLCLAIAAPGCGDDDSAPSAPPGGTNNDTGGANNDTTGGTNNDTTAANNDTTANNDGGGSNNDPSSNNGGGSNNDGGGSNNDPANNDDPVNNVPDGECDAVAQDCPEEQQCIPIDGVETCVPRNPTQAEEGAECGGGDCAVGLQCVNWGGDRGTRCAAMCDRMTGEGCAEGTQCSAFVRLNPDIGLCDDIPASCDIYAQDCEEGRACTFGRDPQTDDPIFICVTEGAQGDGQPCGSDNGRCMAGLVCIRDDDTSSTCHAVCEDDEGCAGEQICSGRATTWDVTFCITPQ